MKNEFDVTFESIINSKTFLQEALAKFGEEKIKKFFARAWEKGHSDGEDSIKSELVDIIEIANIAVE